MANNNFFYALSFIVANAPLTSFTALSEKFGLTPEECKNTLAWYFNKISKKETYSGTRYTTDKQCENALYTRCLLRIFSDNCKKLFSVNELADILQINIQKTASLLSDMVFNGDVEKITEAEVSGTKVELKKPYYRKAWKQY